MDFLLTPTIAKPVAALARSLVEPAIRRVKQRVDQKMEVVAHKLFGGYSNYLNTSFERHSYFHSIVFRNEQKLLLSYYIPLRLAGTDKSSSIAINNFPEKLGENNRTLIVDTAGMGKTTLLKVLFLKCIEQQIGIPIFIELRKLSRKTSLLQFISDQLTGIDGKKEHEVLIEFLTAGKFVFFLDGYDEISDEDRTAVTADLQNFIHKVPSNRFFLTSRDELSLTAFPSFQRFSIAPLEKAEAYELLMRYGDRGAVAQSLVEKLDEPENSKIHEFLTNPLLTSLLFKSFEFRHTIPLKKHIFYRQVFESLFESHDLTKEGGEFHRAKRCGLAIDRFEKVLRAFGALTYRAAKVELNQDEAIEFVEKARTLTGERKLDCTKFLHDLTHAVPLMAREGNYLRWSHRSIQEYFAAQYLCKALKEKTEAILLEYVNGEFGKHANFLLLCADIDRAAFDRSVTRSIAEQLLNEWDIRVSARPANIRDNQFKERLELTVGKVIFLARTPASLIDLGDLSADELEQYHELMATENKEIFDVMQKYAGTDFYGARISHGDPGCGFLDTHLGTLMANFGHALEWDFYVRDTIKAGSDRNFPLPFSTDSPILVNDDPASPVNSPEAYSVVNRCLARHAMWRFDEEKARTFLRKLAINDYQRHQLEPW